MSQHTYIEAIRRALRESLTEDASVFLLGEDIGPRGGVFQATAGLTAEFGDQRVLDTPLAESGIIGVAIGAALAGMRPVAEIQFADFVYPGLNQLLNEAAKLRYRSAGGWTCPLVVRMPYGGVHGGGLYHGGSVEAMFVHAPGLRVLSPSTPSDAYNMLRWAIRCDDPVVFLEPKRIYASVREDLPERLEDTPPATILRRQGEDVTCVAWGLMLHVALAASAQLEGEGIGVAVLDPRTLRPLDMGPILDSVRQTGRLCIVHEDTPMCAMGAEIGMRVAEEALFHLDAPPVRITAPEVPGVPYAPELERLVVPSLEQVTAALRTLALY
jgi:2-oxoisovalerate dehydrogenase E1 component beta subunit